MLMSRLRTTDNGRNVKIEPEFWKQNSQFLVIVSSNMFRPAFFYFETHDTGFALPEASDALQPAAG